MNIITKDDPQAQKSSNLEDAKSVGDLEDTIGDVQSRNENEARLQEGQTAMMATGRTRTAGTLLAAVELMAWWRGEERPKAAIPVGLSKHP